MAGKVNIRDFFLKLGFDSSEVEKGLKKLDKELLGVNKRLTSHAKMQESISKKANMSQAKRNQGLKQQNDLISKQATLAIRAATAQQSADRKAESIRIRQANMSTQAGMRVRDIDNKLTPPTLDLGQTRQKLKSVRDDIIRIQKAMKTATGREEMNTLKNGLQQARQEAGHLTTRMSKLTREMEKQKFVANSLKDSMRNMARSYVSMFAIIGGAGMAGASGQGLVQARTSLLASTGDAKSAGEAFEFVKEQAMNFGIGIQAATKGYSKIAVAAKTAGLSLDQAKEIFLSAAESATAFGLSTEETSGIIKAFSDILSKGTVSAEEVKGQLTH